MNSSINVVLNDGTPMPRIGFGTNVLQGQSGITAIETALKTGYRLIDTAQSYGNEEEVGQAVADSGLSREDVFITTKIKEKNQGYQKTIDSLQDSLEKLQLDQVDLALVHWPSRENFDLSIETWKALIDLREQGKVKAIGVSNYTSDLIQRTMDASGVVPAVNQVEFHPFLFQKALMDYCQDNEILIESYCPIARADLVEKPVLQRLAEKYNKSPVQVILRWHLEHNLVPIPRSTDPDHIKENLEIFDFSLTADETAEMDALDEGYRIIDSPRGPWNW